MVERVGTPVKAIPKGNGLYTVIWYERVAGDHRALLPGGRSVLVESKTRTGKDYLSFGDFKDHQVKALTKHAELGGISLIAWVSNFGVYLMQWPVDGFKKGEPIHPDKADQLDIMGIGDLLLSKD